MPELQNARALPLELLLERLPDATVLVDGSGIVRWANGAAAERLGRPRDEWIGTSSLDLIHPGDIDAALLALASVQGKHFGTPLELRIRTSTGWRLAEVIGAPVADEAGHILLSIRDLTERRRWEVATDETAKLRSLVHHAPTLFLLLDVDGTVQATSGAITRLLGHDQAELEGRPVTDIVEPGERTRLESALARAVRGEPRTTPERVEVHLRDARLDVHVPYELTIVDLSDDPTVTGMLVTGHDVSERAAAADDLRDMLSLLHATLDSTADGIVVVDLEGTITSVNARFVEMWRLPPEQVKPGADHTVLANTSRQLVDPDGFRAAVRALYADPERESIDVLHFADGRVYERYSTPQRVAGEVVGRVWSFHDITRQKELERELHERAFHDSLTGLANQSLFSQQLTRGLEDAVRTGAELAVLYFDIDDFKLVNDSLGHPAGDLVLTAVADRLRHCVREADTIARLGGDEFAVLVYGPDARRGAVEMADRIIDVLRRPMRIAGRQLMSSVSVGVAHAEPGIDAEQMLRNADLAMYAAKRRGKTRREVYVADMHAEAVARLELEADLRRACELGQFWIAYQPVVELATSRTVGVEALLRWQHPVWGELGPDDFVHAAEDIGVIGEIGQFVLAGACEELQACNRAGGDEINLSVNVSARQLTDGSIVAQVASALDTSGLPASRLILELTETAMVHDTCAATRTLADLQSLGVRLALDDFGTGFSSLTHLQQFPIDIIKIDRSFMTAALEDAGLVRAVVRMSQELGLVAVAEGIETADQVRFLQEIGCRFGQGYFFARPARSASDHAITRHA